MDIKKYIAVIMAAAVCLSGSAFAKSDDLIDYNLDKMRALLNENDFRVFYEGSAKESVYYGAKFEPRSGVIVGTPANKQYDGIKNGIDTVYEWFVPSDEITNDKITRIEKPETKSDHSKLIGYNLNFASKTPVNMSKYENYIKNKIDDIAAMGADVLLIFGKEMNIDNNFLDEKVFIDCFRYVADYAHTKENIAMVWAPNDTGGLDTRLIDFYPGDEYVDWIGCSLYSMPYFTGDKYATEGSNIGFIMGPYANPVMRAKVIHEFMTENNIKKPVFITEGGIGYESPDGEDFTPWAVQQLRKYYGEMIRVYPEFKCIVSFNNYVPEGDYYRYDMGNNPELLQNMKYLIQDPIFITDYPSDSEISYKNMFDGIDFFDKVKLSAYGYMPKIQYMTVKYIIDGQTVHQSLYPPYNYETTDLSLGNHHLDVEFYVSGELVKTKSYDFGFKTSFPRIYKSETAQNHYAFPDLQYTPAEMKNSVTSLAAIGVLTGKENGKFEPKEVLTRAELAAVICRALGLDAPKDKSAFSDTPSDAWYFDYVLAARDLGLIEGFEDGSFHPNSTVTNEQIITIAARCLEMNGLSPKSCTLPYIDSINAWVQPYLETAHSYGIDLPYSDNTFHGQRAVSRGDTAVIINRLLNTI